MLKMFVNYIIKTPTCFSHSCWRVHNLTFHRQVHQALTHIPNKQLDDTNKQRSSNSTKHGKRPPEDGQTRVTKTCRGFNDVIYKHF